VHYPLPAHILGFVAVTTATINVVGGFGITDRMLKMFGKRKPEAKREEGGGQVSLTSYFMEATYLVASILFILALKMMSHPETARKGMFLAEGGMFAAIVGTLVARTSSPGCGSSPASPSAPSSAHGWPSPCP
jgi:hypothetical protein